MVDRVEALYKLQLIDMEIDEKRETLSHVESGLDQDDELLSAQRRLAKAEEALRKSRSELRRFELDLQEISSKIASTQEMLYGGEITNPKELASLEQEIEYLKRRQSEVEDTTLETMAQVEENESRFRTGEQHFQRMEQEWQATQEDLHQQAEELRSRLESLKAQKDEAILVVPEEDVAVYEDLRRLRGGQAVALLEGGICLGCRVALPTSLVQKVRRGQDLVYCGSCQRILYYLS